MDGLIVGVNISSWHNHVTFFAFQNILCTMKCVGAIIRNRNILLATILEYISYIKHIIFDEIKWYCIWRGRMNKMAYQLTHISCSSISKSFLWFSPFRYMIFSIECKLEGYWGQIKRLKMLKKRPRTLRKLRLPLQNRV